MDKYRPLKFIFGLAARLFSLFTTLVIVVGFVVIGAYLYGIRPYVVVSGSMEPAIHVGSVCLVNRRVSYGSIRQNDVIAFKAGSALVTHRAVRLTDSGIITKGDANNIEDASAVTAENFVGKTLFSVPRLGYAVILIQSKRGKIICGTVIALVFLYGLLSGGKSDESERME